MRDEFVESFLKLHGKDPSHVFLTGDLGFGALEPVRDALGDRFINCGIAEQNMVSMAAGLASEGFTVWAYSIAPFLYARAFEQVRNDLCFHESRVRLVGNGGGLTYGVMGPSHLAFDDYGVLGNGLGLQIHLPISADHVYPTMLQFSNTEGPLFLRLARAPSEPNLLPFSGDKQLVKVADGPRGVVVSCAPLIHELVRYNSERLLEERYSVYAVQNLPLPAERMRELIDENDYSKSFFAVEEHVWHGGIGMSLFAGLSLSKIPVAETRWRGIPNESMNRYGSAEFQRELYGLTGQQVLKWCDEVRD